MARAKKSKKQDQFDDLTNNVDDSGNKKDRSPYVHQKQKIRFSLDIHQRYELTERQKVILETMIDKHTNCVFVDALFGSGKTYLAVLAALKLLNDKKIDQILYLRSCVESSSTSKIGFLPAGIQEKFSPYGEVFFDKLDELLDQSQIDRIKKEGHIEALPINFTRGKSWSCKAIIVDESSNLSEQDIILLLTRCGKFTKIFFIGDSLNQSDIGSKTGFRKVFNAFDDMESKENGVFTFELRNSEDIVRSGAVRFYLQKLGMIKY
jgi:predicted ribonuclease YlaK